jgi:hypothetical protein
MMTELDRDTLDQLIDALTEPFGDAVRERKGAGGQTFRYISGKTAFDRLNTVATHMGLAVSTGITAPPQIVPGVQPDHKGTIWDEIWITGWLEIHGAGRKSDVGSALHMNEDSVKGAHTDMLKRCLRQYGMAGELYEDAAPSYQGTGGGYQQQAPPQQQRQAAPQQQRIGVSQGGQQQEQRPGSRSDASGNFLLSENQMKYVSDIMDRTNWDPFTVIANVLSPETATAVGGDFSVLRYRDGKAVLDAMIANEKTNPSWGVGSNGYGGNGEADPYAGQPPLDDHRFNPAPVQAPATAPASGAIIPNLGAKVLDWQAVVKEAGHDPANWRPLVSQAGHAVQDDPSNEWMFEVLIQFSDRLLLEGLDAYLTKQAFYSNQLKASLNERRQQQIEAESKGGNG